MSKATILFVDDQAFIRHFYKRTLEGEGYNVLEAVNGEEALKILETEESINIIFLDAVMPVMDGFETSKKIRSLPAFSDIPIIFLTGNSDEEAISLAMKAGASDFLVKGSNPKEIIPKVEKFL